MSDTTVPATEQDLDAEVDQTVAQYDGIDLGEFAWEPLAVPTHDPLDPADLLWDAVENGRDAVTAPLDEWLDVWAGREGGLPYAEQVGQALDDITAGLNALRTIAVALDQGASWTNHEDRPMALSWGDDDWGPDPYEFDDPDLPDVGYLDELESRSVALQGFRETPGDLLDQHQPPTDDFAAANAAVLAQLLGGPTHKEEQEAELASLMSGLTAEKINVEGAQA